MTVIDLSPFDAAEYPDIDEVIAAHLSAAMEEEKSDMLLIALLDVARAQLAPT